MRDPRITIDSCAKFILALLLWCCLGGDSFAEAPTEEAKVAVCHRLEKALAQIQGKTTFLGKVGWNALPERDKQTGIGLDELSRLINEARSLGTPAALQARDAALAEAGISLSDADHARTEWGELASLGYLAGRCHGVSKSMDSSKEPTPQQLAALLWDPTESRFVTAARQVVNWSTW